jgi:RHS repeat-associated protein
MSDNGDIRYFVTDHLGSTTKMINANGSKYPNEINFEIKYYSWGSDQPDIPDLGTSFKYTGQRQAEAGLYFFNARWYDPELGRFIQADTIIPEPGNPLAWDRYAYGYNNPVKNTDPTGHASESYCEQAPISYRSQCLAAVGAPPITQHTIPLAVEPQQQRDPNNPNSAGTNCGQFCFAMGWSYLHPDNALTGKEVSTTADEEGWHIYSFPFTSPSSMVKMAQHYNNQSTGTREEHGNIVDGDNAKGLLDDVTKLGFPVIVDVTVDVASNSDHDMSNTHFVLVTGVVGDNVYYNDPFLGQAKSTTWKNFWSSWSGNFDPGGQGWYLIIY